jgi:hypothetical protein
VPLEERPNHRDVRRGDGDCGLDDARPGSCEAYGEVGVRADVAAWLVAKKGIRRMRSFVLCPAVAMADG